MVSTLASVIIQSAHRENNLIAAGASPSTAESTEALALLNSFVFGTFGFGMGEELTDWLAPGLQRTASVAANFPQLPYPLGLDGALLALPSNASLSVQMFPYPPKNSRIVFGGVTTTVWFPEQPLDGSRMALVQGSGAGDSGAAGQTITLDGNGRTIEASNTKTYVDPVAARQWLYRADLGDWVAVVPFVATDPMPFPTELDDLWITALNIRLSPRYGKAVTAETAATFKNMFKIFKARYRQAGTTTYNSQDIPRALESYISGRWFW